MFLRCFCVYACACVCVCSCVRVEFVVFAPFLYLSFHPFRFVSALQRDLVLGLGSELRRTRAALLKSTSKQIFCFALSSYWFLMVPSFLVETPFEKVRSHLCRHRFCPWRCNQHWVRADSCRHCSRPSSRRQTVRSPLHPPHWYPSFNLPLVQLSGTLMLLSVSPSISPLPPRAR